MSTSASLATHYESIVVKTKRLLHRSPSGVNGIRSLSRSFGISDDCGGATMLTRETFRSALADNGVSLSDAEMEVVFSMLDRAANNVVDPAEFIASLRHDMSPLRRAWLRRVWSCFRKRNDAGCVPIAEMQEAFRAERHTDVVRGTRTVEEVVDEFLATFNETTNPDGTVSPQEFQEYYAGVSAAFCDDESFVAMLRGVWPMAGVNDEFTMSLATGKETISKTFSVNQTIAEKQSISDVKRTQAEMMRIIVDEHRPAVMASGIAMRQLSRALRLACGGSDNGMFMSVDEFCSVLSACRLYVTDASAARALDTNGDSSVDVLYYLALLVPPMPAARELMLERMWQNVFPTKDGEYRVGVRDFQSRFLAGAGEERNAFLSAWDVRTAVDGKVTLDELVEWYAPFSAKVQLDRDFETLLARQWKGFATTLEN